jgi:hypothetical protein
MRDQQLQHLQEKAFAYFEHETSPLNGLVRDKSAADWPASIAATGLALASFPVAIERGLIATGAAIERTLSTLRFLWNSSQGPQPDASGHHGFTIIFSTCTRAGAPGSANCPRWTVLSFWRAR